MKDDPDHIPVSLEARLDAINARLTKIDDATQQLLRRRRRLSDYLYAKLRPRLWVLRQYEPRDLALPARYFSEAPPPAPPRIAIVTPSYNHGSFLKKTIDSVLTQNYPNLAYLVQDAASTDDTVDILKSYGDRLGWSSEPDTGQACAINRGFTRIDGDIMAYLNSDDVLLPGALNYVARAFNGDPSLDVVYGHRICIDDNSREIAVWILPGHDSDAIRWVDFIPQETMFWRKRVWDEVGLFDEAFCYALDWDFILRTHAKGFKFKRLPRFLAAFRVHPNQKTTAMNAVGVEECEALRKRHLGFVPTQTSTTAALRKYLTRHVALHLSYRLGVYRP